jgi:hypothetical protein
MQQIYTLGYRQLIYKGRPVPQRDRAGGQKASYFEGQRKNSSDFELQDLTARCVARLRRCLAPMCTPDKVAAARDVFLEEADTELPTLQ